MKYCVKCNMELGNIELVEKDNKTFCPKCKDTEIHEINSTKLEGLVKDITNAFYNIKETKVQNNAQELIKNAKTIELGEKKLKKEFMRREKQLNELEYEISVILSIAEKLNYKM